MFHEGTGKVMNTIPLGGFSFYEMLNEIVQQEPATSLGAELAGSLAAIVIIKGEAWIALPIVGSLIVVVAMALFAVIVFRTSQT